MSKDVKGVFVRLPLSGDQKTCFYSRHYTGDPTPGLIAIGMPVAGWDLEVVGMRTRDMRSIATSAWHYSGDVENDASTYETQFLICQSDALAKLAEKDAEIARLRAGLARIERQANEYPGDDAAALGWIVSECDALKGPAA